MSVNMSSFNIDEKDIDMSPTSETGSDDIMIPSGGVLLYRGSHKAMSQEQLDQLYLRDEEFAVPLLKEILRRIESGFAKYTKGGQHDAFVDVVCQPHDNQSSSADATQKEDQYQLDQQKFMSEYERLVSRFNEVASMFASYYLDWSFMKRISDVMYPLVCSVTLARRTNSLWVTLVQRMMAIYGTKKAHVVPPFTIPWRPLCDLIIEIIGEPRVQVEAPSDNRDNPLFGKDTLNTLVEGCCRYFDDKAFGEIWAFLKPRMQRKSAEFYLGLFCGLLPVHRCCKTEAQRLVAKDVLDTLFDWSEGRFNFLFGFGFQTCDILYYIATGPNIGRFDLTPYAERIFTLNLRMSGLRSDFVTTTHTGFGLPQLRVGVGNAAYFAPSKLGDFKNTAIATAIAYSLPNDTTNVLWSHLRRFLRACETYTCSSSASTQQSQSVAEWMWRFTASFVERVRQQKLETFPIPEAFALSEATIDTFVEMLRKHVVERLYRTRGNATELIRLVALSPKSMLPYLQKLVVQGAASGPQTSFPQVALGMIGLIAQQSLYIDDDSIKLAVRAMVLSQREWVIECLEDINGPNFISGCNALAGMTAMLPMGAIYENEVESAMRITQALFKLTVNGGRDDQVATISYLLLFLYRACHPATLAVVAEFVVSEVRNKASSEFSERIFLSALSAYIPDTVMDLYFPVAEEVLTNPRSTLQEKKTHMEFFGTLSPGPTEVAIRYAPRIAAVVRKVLTHITSSDMINLTGRLIHSMTHALMLPRTDGRLCRDDEIDTLGMFRVVDGRDSKIRWILPSDEGKLLAVNIYVELTTWAMDLLRDVPSATIKLKKMREDLGIPLYDHEEEYSNSSVRRGLARFLQLSTGDAGRLLLTASTAFELLRGYAAAVKKDPAAVLDNMMLAVHPSSYGFPYGVNGAFDSKDPKMMEQLKSTLAKASTERVIEVLLQAAREAEESDDAVSSQSALTAIHMLHGVNFSSGSTLRDICASFNGDPARLSRKRPYLYYIGMSSAASYDVSAYMTRDEVSESSRRQLISSIEHFTNSPFVKVAKEAQDVLLLHVRHMTVKECQPFIERMCANVADFISGNNDITGNTIAEKNFVNSFVVASSLCTVSMTGPIKTLLAPFINNTVQLKCRPSVETTIEKILNDLLGKIARCNQTEESDWLLDVILKVTNPSFTLTPQKRVMFLDQLSVLRLRRTDRRFVQKLADLSLQSLHMLHSRDLTLVMAGQGALAGVTHSLFRTKLLETVTQPDPNDADAYESYKTSLLKATRLRTMGTITIPSAFNIYAPVKAVTLQINGGYDAASGGGESEGNGADADVFYAKGLSVATNALQKDDLIGLVGGGGKGGVSNKDAGGEGSTPTNVSFSTSAAVSSSALDARRWSLKGWRDWMLTTLRRLSVGDCGNTYRTLIMFVTRLVLLSNFQLAPPFLSACAMVLADYKSVVDTTRKKESGAAVCAFSMCRTIENLLRAEVHRLTEKAHTLSFGPQGAEPPSFLPFLNAYIDLYGHFIERFLTYICDNASMTTETFYEFASVSPIDSEELKSRLIACLLSRVQGCGTSFNVPSTPADEGRAPASPGYNDNDDDTASNLNNTVTSPTTTTKSLFRYYCFLVTLSSANTYEHYKILETNHHVLNFFERQMGAIIAESSQSSAIAQQLVDQIGHFVTRTVHYAHMWESDAWPFTKGITERSELIVKRLMARSIDSMTAACAGEGAAFSSIANGVDSANGSISEADTNPNNGGRQQTHMSSVSENPAGGDAADITVRAGDTCKFEVLLIIRILSLSMSELLENLLPEIVEWLYTAQKWVSDDAPLADRILSLSRNVVTRDINKASSHVIVNQLCDLLLAVAAQGQKEAEAELGGDEDETDDNNQSASSPNSALHRGGGVGGGGMRELRSPGFDLASPETGVLSPPMALTNMANINNDTITSDDPARALGVLSPQPEMIPPRKIADIPIQHHVDPSSTIPPSLLDPHSPKLHHHHHASNGSKRKSQLSSTRRVVLMLTAMLHRALFLNLHRIGKFSMLQRCADAMSASLGSLTSTSKSDHKLVAKNAIAVLVRVSSDDQITALINPHIDILRKAQAADGGLVAIARNTTDPNQLRSVKKAVHFLCAVALAYPEQVPPFCGKILKMLAPYGTAPVSEIKNAVSQMFKQWWRTHRERWEYEFKDMFTPAQQTLVLEYWSSSSYYA